MRKKNKKKKVTDLSENDMKILMTKAIEADVAGYMINAEPEEVTSMRYRLARKEQLAEASRVFRQKVKTENLQRFGKEHGCYNYWTEEEIEYILTSEDSDKEQALRLNKTVAAVQQKRSRELAKRRKKGKRN